MRVVRLCLTFAKLYKSCRVLPCDQSRLWLALLLGFVAFEHLWVED